jgi:hypothetical protein
LRVVAAPLGGFAADGRAAINALDAERGRQRHRSHAHRAQAVSAV